MENGRSNGIHHQNSREDTIAKPCGSGFLQLPIDLVIHVLHWPPKRKHLRSRLAAGSCFGNSGPKFFLHPCINRAHSNSRNALAGHGKDRPAPERTARAAGRPRLRRVSCGCAGTKNPAPRRSRAEKENDRRRCRRISGRSRTRWPLAGSGRPILSTKTSGPSGASGFPSSGGAGSPGRPS